MKREFLKGLGISEELVESIMAEHGKTVEANKTEAETLRRSEEELKKQLEEANSQIRTFKDMDIDGVRKAAKDWEEKAKNAEAESKKRIAEMQLDHAVERELSGAKARNHKAVLALIDREKLTLENDTVKGLSEQLEDIKKENEYLFEGEKQPPAPQFSGRTFSAQREAEDAAIRQAMGLPPKK